MPFWQLKCCSAVRGPQVHAAPSKKCTGNEYLAEANFAESINKLLYLK